MGDDVFSSSALRGAAESSREEMRSKRLRGWQQMSTWLFSYLDHNEHIGLGVGWKATDATTRSFESCPRCNGLITVRMAPLEKAQSRVRTRQLAFCGRLGTIVSQLNRDVDEPRDRFARRWFFHHRYYLCSWSVSARVSVLSLWSGWLQRRRCVPRFTSDGLMWGHLKSFF